MSAKKREFRLGQPRNTHASSRKETKRACELSLASLGVSARTLVSCTHVPWTGSTGTASSLLPPAGSLEPAHGNFTRVMLLKKRQSGFCCVATDPRAASSVQAVLTVRLLHVMLGIGEEVLSPRPLSLSPCSPRERQTSKYNRVWRTFGGLSSEKNKPSKRVCRHGAGENLVDHKQATVVHCHWSVRTATTRS